MTLEQIIQSTLAGHIVGKKFGAFLNCKCGWNVNHNAPEKYETQYRYHLASELSKAVRPFCEYLDIEWGGDNEEEDTLQGEK